MREQKADVRDRLVREKKLTDAIVADLKAALTEFKAQFRPPPAAPALAGAEA